MTDDRHTTDHATVKCVAIGETVKSLALERFRLKSLNGVYRRITLRGNWPISELQSVTLPPDTGERVPSLPAQRQSTIHVLTCPGVEQPG